MDKCNWQSGKLLAHVHKRWGIGDTVQLECLINGANGVWASVCEEGAAMGHACSAITLMNLIRMGNKESPQKVQLYLSEDCCNKCHQNNDREGTTPKTDCVWRASIGFEF